MKLRSFPMRGSFFNRSLTGNYYRAVTYNISVIQMVFYTILADTNSLAFMTNQSFISLVTTTFAKLGNVNRIGAAIVNNKSVIDTKKLMALIE